MVIKKFMKQALKICLKNTQWDSLVFCLLFVYSFRGQTLKMVDKLSMQSCMVRRQNY